MGAMPIAKHRSGDGRLAWIDELRFFAFCAVAVQHVAWIHDTTLGRHDLLTFSTRFAVPVFFMISGFLTVRRNRTVAEVGGTVFRRLVPVFLFWEAVFVVADLLAEGAFYPLPDGGLRSVVRFALISVYNGGAAFHLWFLVWLAVAELLLAALRGGALRRTVAVALFAVGLAIGPYGGFTGMVDHVGFLTTQPSTYTARNGPFFGLAFLLIGELVVRRDLRLSPVAALALAAVGLALVVAEGVAIATWSSRPVSVWDVTFGTPAFALGVLLFFRAVRETAASTVVSRLGRLSLGAYCVHVLFVDLWNLRFPPANREAMPLWATLAGAAGVIVASFVVAALMARVRGLRRFVV